jgi:hypothetical protein
MVFSRIKLNTQHAPKKAPVAEVRLRIAMNEASCSDERRFMFALLPYQAWQNLPPAF